MHNYDFISVFDAFDYSPHLFTNQKASSRNSPLKIKLNSADISVSSVSFFYCPILSYTSWQKQTNKQHKKNLLVAPPGDFYCVWTAPAAVRGEQRRRQRQNEGLAALQWTELQ